MSQIRFKLVIPERIIAVDTGRKKGQAGSNVTELTLSDEEEEALLEEVEKRKLSEAAPGRCLQSGEGLYKSGRPGLVVTK